MIERIFNIVIESGTVMDKKDYVIHCPQLKGCVTQGDSVEDALLMFADALNCYINSVIKHGDKV